MGILQVLGKQQGFGMSFLKEIGKIQAYLEGGF
jgi:hypothetical protein